MNDTTNRAANHINEPELIDDDVAAAMLGIKPETLANWRYLKSVALKYVKVGRRVKYKRADVLAFIESNTIAG